MFSCFGGKSSSQKDKSKRRNTTTVSHQDSEIRRISKETNRRKTVTTRTITTQKSTTQTKSELCSPLLRSTSVPYSTRTGIDGTIYGVQPLDASVLSRFRQSSSSNRIRDQNAGPSYAIPSSLTVQNSNDPPQNVKGYKVKKTNKYYDNVSGDPLPVYQTHSKNRGQVLIINNVKFYKENSERKGAVKDENDINDVLKQIGFKVEKHRNVKKNDIGKILKQFIGNKKKLVEADICLVVIMSHGTNNNIPGGYTEILCVDGERLSTEEIIDYFNGANCQFLKDKPKIFIFQCCRNNLYEKDAIRSCKKPEDKSNTLIAYSTIPGFTSNRDIQNGTWYIQTICKIFSKHAHEHHIEDLLKMVESEMKNIDPHMRQVSCFENRGFARCYLHPR